MTTKAYIPSPCVGICTLEEDLCVGCLRSAHDILNWSRWSDAERAQALTLRDDALRTSFEQLFIRDDDALLWQSWEAHVGWLQRPETVYEAWFQVLETANWKHLPADCGITGRLELGTTERCKALKIWLKQLKLLRASAESGSSQALNLS